MIYRGESGRHDEAAESEFSRLSLGAYLSKYRSTNQRCHQTRPKRAHTIRHMLFAWQSPQILRLSVVSLSLLDSSLALKHHLRSLTWSISQFIHPLRDAMTSVSSTLHKRSFTGHHLLMPAAQEHTRDLFVSIVPTQAFISWTFGRGTVVRISSP
jgi:hypothetical protein